jgi:hypothetical protein
MGKWTDADTARETGDSSSQAAHAGHAARDDCETSGEFERGNDEKNSKPFSRDDAGGRAATGFWKSIFGK